MAATIRYMWSFRIHFKVQKTQNNRWFKKSICLLILGIKEQGIIESNKLEIKFTNHKDLGNFHAQPLFQTLRQAFPKTQILPCMHLQN